MKIFKYKKSISALLVAAMTGVVLFSAGSAFGVGDPEYNPDENAGIFPKFNGLYIGKTPSPEVAEAIAEAFATGFTGLYVDGPAVFNGQFIVNGIGNGKVELNGDTDVDGKFTVDAGDADIRYNLTVGNGLYDEAGNKLDGWEGMDAGNLDVKKNLTVDGSVKTNDIQSALPGLDIVVDAGNGTNLDIRSPIINMGTAQNGLVKFAETISAPRITNDSVENVGRLKLYDADGIELVGTISNNDALNGGDVVFGDDVVMKSAHPDANSDGYATLQLQNIPNNGLLAFAYRNINAIANDANPANALYLNDLSKGPVNIGEDLVVNNDILMGGNLKDLDGNVINYGGAVAAGGDPFDGTLSGDLTVWGNAFIQGASGGDGTNGYLYSDNINTDKLSARNTDKISIQSNLEITSNVSGDANGNINITGRLVNPSTAQLEVGSGLSVSGGLDVSTITNNLTGKTNGRLKLQDPDGILITNSIANDNIENNGGWVKINDDQGLKISSDLDVDGETIIRSAALIGANGSAPFKIDPGEGVWTAFGNNSITTYEGPLHLNAHGSDQDVMIGFPLLGSERSNLIVFGDTDVDGLLTASQIGKFTVKSTGKMPLPFTSLLNSTTLFYSVSCPADYWVVSCGVDYTTTNIIPSVTTNTSSACVYFFNKNGWLYKTGTVLNAWVTLSQTCWKTETDKWYSDSEDYL